MENYVEQLVEFYRRYEEIPEEELNAVGVKRVQIMAEPFAKNPMPPRLTITYVDGTVGICDGFTSIYEKMYELFKK